MSNTLPHVDAETRVYPPWRYAKEKLLEEGLTYGSFVSHERLCELFELPFFTKDSVVSKGDMDARDIRYMNYIRDLTNNLRHEHKMDLVSDRGKGYRVLKIGEAVPVAFKDMNEEIAKAASKGMERLNAAPFELMTHEEAAKAREMMSRAAHMAQAIRHSRRPKLQLSKPDTPSVPNENDSGQAG